MKGSLMLREPEMMLDNLHQEFNNFLKDTFFDTDFFSPERMAKMSTWRPAIEMKQSEKDYTIKVQLPGVRKEDINIDLENDFMTISAEMKEEKCEKPTNNETAAKKNHVSEFRYGKFVRTISFDNPIKVDESTAEYKDGILKIIMPKQKIQKAHTKRLNIK